MYPFVDLEEGESTEIVMILGGMGPANELSNSSAKLFASIYALYSGVAIISTVAVIITPVLHRMMHKFHLKEDGD